MSENKPPERPLIAFDENGQASILDYDLPTTTSYYGNGLYDLGIPGDRRGDNWFTPDAFEKPTEILPDKPSEPVKPEDPHDPPKFKGEIDKRADILEDAGYPVSSYREASIYADALSKAAQNGKELQYKLTHDFNSKIQDLKKIDNFFRNDWNKFQTDYKEMVDRYQTSKEVRMRNSQYWNPIYDKMGILKSEDIESKPRLAVSGQEAPDFTLNDEQSLSTNLQLTADEIIDLANNGKRVVPVRRQSGDIEAKITSQPFNDNVHPKILIVEHYRLSSFLGNYGAGQTLNTYTLLPGEETTFSIRTWRQKEETLKECVSILDSYDEKKANEFQDELHNENSDQQKIEEMNSWGVSAQASANWFWGSASVSAEAKGSTNQSRDTSSKIMANVVSKQVSETNRKRQTQVETSKQVTMEEGQETQITRTIKNVNLSRVMNFVFRQLNQEYISYLHLMDVHIAFVNGYVDCTRESSLADLPGFLTKYIKPEHRKEVADMIYAMCKNVNNYHDDKASLIEEVDSQTDKYWRVKHGHVFPESYQGDFEAKAMQEDPVHFRYLDNVPGIILNKMSSILVTDAVIVDALLGQGVALDDYALKSQSETLRRKQLDNSMIEAETEKLRIALSIIQAKDSEQADIFQKLFPPKPIESKFDNNKGDNNG